MPPLGGPGRRPGDTTKVNHVRGVAVRRVRAKMDAPSTAGGQAQRSWGPVSKAKTEPLAKPKMGSQATQGGQAQRTWSKPAPKRPLSYIDITPKHGAPHPSPAGARGERATIVSNVIGLNTKGRSLQDQERSIDTLKNHGVVPGDSTFESIRKLQAKENSYEAAQAAKAKAKANSEESTSPLNHIPFIGHTLAHAEASYNNYIDKELNAQGFITKTVPDFLAHEVTSALSPRTHGAERGGGSGLSTAFAQAFGTHTADKAAEIGGNAARDLIDIPAQVIPSAYLTGRAGVKAAGGDSSELKALGEGLKGQLSKKGFEEHPLFAALLLKGGVSAIGHTLGTGARVGGRLGSDTLREVGSSKRASLKVPGLNQPIERRYSHDLFTKGRQILTDRALDKPATAQGPIGDILKAAQKRGNISRIRKAVDSEVGSLEDRRRLQRLQVFHGLAKARPKRGLHELVSYINDGGIRNPMSARSDLHKLGKELDAEHAKGEMLPHQAWENRQQREQVTRALEAIKKNPSKIAKAFHAADVYAGRQNEIDSLLVKHGHLLGEQARKAKLIPYAVRHMEAKYDAARRVSAAGERHDAAQAKVEETGAAVTKLGKDLRTADRREFGHREATKVRVATADRKALHDDGEYRVAAHKVGVLGRQRRSLAAGGAPGRDVVVGYHGSRTGATRAGFSASHDGPTWLSESKSAAKGYGDPIEVEMHLRKTVDLGTEEGRATLADATKRAHAQGKKLSEVLKKDGYDAIVHHQPGGKSYEVLDAARLRKPGTSVEGQIRALDKRLEAAKAEMRKATETFPERFKKTHGTKPRAGLSKLERLRADVMLAAERHRTAKEELHTAKQELRAQFVKKGDRSFIPGLVDKHGEPLNSDAILAHMKTNGVDEKRIAYFTQRPGVLGSAAGFKSMNDTHYEARFTRTGSATRKGTYDASFSALIDSQIRSQGILDAITARQHLIDTFVTAKARTEGGVNGWWKGHKDAAEAARKLSHETGIEMVPYRLHDMRLDRERADAFKQDLEPGTLDALQEHSLQQKDMLNGLPADDAQSNFYGDTQGQYGLIPKEVATRLRAHDQFTSLIAFDRGLQAFTQRWRVAILHGTSVFKWTFGNAAELVLRLAIAKAGPLDYLTGRRVVAAALEEMVDPQDRAHFKARVLSGGHFTGTQQNMIRDAMRKDDQGALLRTMRGLVDSKAGTVTGLKALRASWEIWERGVLAVNRAIETGGDYAAIGQLAQQDRRGLAEFHASWKDSMVMGKTAAEQVAKGLLETPEQMRYGRYLHETIGKYTQLSPSARSIVSKYSTFGLWFGNAAKFVFYTMPAKHPIATALAASMYVATQDERKPLGQDLFGKGALPDFLQGTIRYGGHSHNWERYTPFGAFSGIGALGDQILPAFSDSFSILAGKDFAGNPLTMPDRSAADPLVRIVMASYVTVESMVPFLPIVRKVQEKGGRQYINSNVFSPKSRQSTQTSHGEAAKKALIPGYKIKDGKKGSKASGGLGSGGLGGGLGSGGLGSGGLGG